MAKTVSYHQSGARFLAQIDGGIEFLVGIQVPYQGRTGLMNEEVTAQGSYDAAAFRDEFGFWADFIALTAVCESHGSFHCLNTYDTAAFTFGFLQYGAHVPNGDFVVWMRSILTLPDASNWFPDLLVHGGRIAKETANGIVELESDASTAALMTYLNPSATEIDVDEIVNAAKLIGWQAATPGPAATQVATGIALFRRAMNLYARKYNLDGAPDTVCAVIADIRHQGRGSSAQIIAALASADPLEALLSIGAAAYQSRCQTLRAELGRRVTAGIFGKRRYSLADNSFH